MDLLDLWLSIYCGYSILINGSPCGYIQATRGIRQGDPLSPFLFVIAMDYLSSLIEDAQNKGLIKGYISPNGLLHITHLLFSVDILLFFVNDKASLQNLRFIIKSFELASGLKINLHKFALAGINVDDASLQMAKNIWVCSISTLPIEYLGMPLGGSPKLEYLWNPIIERIDRKLHSWHHSYISKGGRLTLIQAVLSNLPTYYLSLFKAPVAVCKSIERKWRNFIWEGTDDKGRSHLVRWDIITSPKNKGGLSIDRVKLTNDALISKWIWRYFTEPNHL